MSDTAGKTVERESVKQLYNTAILNLPRPVMAASMHRHTAREQVNTDADEIQHSGEGSGVQRLSYHHPAWFDIQL